jgi:hypothetical protein
MTIARLKTSDLMIAPLFARSGHPGCSAPQPRMQLLEGIEMDQKTAQRPVDWGADIWGTAHRQKLRNFPEAATLRGRATF